MTTALPPELDVGREPLTQERWARAMGWIAAKLRAYDAFQPSWTAAVDEMRQFGLTRINDALLPVHEQLQSIASVGALFTATSTSSASVGTGARTFSIAEPDRARFAAAAYLAVHRAGDTTTGMWGVLQSYDRTTGQLTILVEHTIGAGNYSAWVISASAAPGLLHDTRTDNPHAVTATQIGALTPDALEAYRPHIHAAFGGL